ncbi:acetylornithine/succinylornithine family transaminase [Pseudomonas sp. LS-2]|uniref:acetylornithine/succinylornithine family transaminase n=1 Tax=Pseudomonas sp. LS-2 TaxID=2315859 RepID=UPI000E755328|nr:acetylornithine/succinylornithine family transaminase [Pseudomonas sp. LS-2]RJX78971.1 acetylornithine/succinylornithine family transaminase [Pseudomonas sp. LS-2]
MSVRADFDRLMVPTYAPAPFVLVRAEGSRVWDSEGRERIDYTGGIAVNVLGHCHPVLVETLRMQAGEIWHVSNAYTNEPALRLARRLTDATFAERVFFCNSGAEANEAAFKLARRVAFDRDGEGRYEIVAAHGSFHGRSLFTVSVGGQPKYSEGFGPAIDGIRHVPFNDLDALRAAVSGSTCAVVLEPVQGEGGVIPADLEYLQGARDICNEHGALLIFDEVQTGVGRVGELYAYQHYGVTPDILTSAKGLGGGFPIGAMLTRADIGVHFPPGTHGTTNGGNPLACSVADAVLSVVDSDEVRRGVIRRRAAFVDQLDALAIKHGVFGPARGLGLLIGCPLHDNWKGLAKVIVTAAAEEGVLLLQAGPDVLRFAPSLVIDPQDIDEGLRRLDRALSKISEARA